MQIRAPNINAQKFARNFVVKRAKRMVQQYLETIGPENLAYLIEKDKNFSEYIPKPVQQKLREAAKSYNWVGALLSDDDVIAMLPEWVRILVAKYDEQGIKWLTRQLSWLRSFIA